jgi:hypothetical protein
VHSEEQAKKFPIIFPTNEIARNKICSADLLNGHEWRKVGCVVENELEFRQSIIVVRTYGLVKIALLDNILYTINKFYFDIDL